MRSAACLIICVLIQIGTIHAQVSCKELYKRVARIQGESFRILHNDDISLSKKIHQSKRISQQALETAYMAIEEYDCVEYSNFIDRIIELELKFGKSSKAEKLALERLNKIYPNWKALNQHIDPSHLSILAVIKNTNKSNSFYTRLRKNKGSYGVCGMTLYEDDVAALLWITETLYNEYGAEYCLKYLQGSTIIINENSDRAKQYWSRIYEFLIQALSLQYSYKELQFLFESAEIQQMDPQIWENGFWANDFMKSSHFFKIGGISIYFKSIPCPTDKNEYKRCPPIDCEALKLKSELYKKIIEYAL